MRLGAVLQLQKFPAEFEQYIYVFIQWQQVSPLLALATATILKSSCVCFFFLFRKAEAVSGWVSHKDRETIHPDILSTLAPDLASSHDQRLAKFYFRQVFSSSTLVKFY